MHGSVFILPALEPGGGFYLSGFAGPFRAPVAVAVVDGEPDVEDTLGRSSEDPNWPRARAG